MSSGAHKNLVTTLQRQNNLAEFNSIVPEFNEEKSEQVQEIFEALNEDN